MQRTAPLSRAARVGRGAAGSLAATALAAASHTLAGGVVTWLAVLATALVALPLSVALAGRVGSLWRLSLAVGAAQVLYHWSFAGLGAASGGAAPSAAPAHAAHLAAVDAFSPALAQAGGADALMWAGHGVAAAATIALLHRGERAVLALLSLVRRAVPVAHPAVPPVLQRPRVPVAAPAPALRLRLFSPAAITHRGPPRAA